MTVSIWPASWSSRNRNPPRKAPSTPPAMTTAPICTSTPRRRRWASTPEMEVPVIWVVAEATATGGGMP